MWWLFNSWSRERNIYWHFLKTCYKPTGKNWHHHSVFSFTWQEVNFKQTDLNRDLIWKPKCPVNCSSYFLFGKPSSSSGFIILYFTFWKPGNPMWTSGRMSNAKSWLGLGMSLYFWGLMDLTTTVLSGTPTPPGKLEALLSDKPQSHSRTKRSWVWNQFFVLEEYTGTDPLYVGKVRMATQTHYQGSEYWKRIWVWTEYEKVTEPMFGSWEQFYLAVCYLAASWNLIFALSDTSQERKDFSPCSYVCSKWEKTRNWIWEEKPGTLQETFESQRRQQQPGE